MRNKTTAKTIHECFLVWIILSQTALNYKNSSACNCQSLGAYQDNLLPQHEAFSVLLKMTVGCCCYCISLMLWFRASSYTYWGEKTNSTTFWEPPRSSKFSWRLFGLGLLVFFIFPRRPLSVLLQIHYIYLIFISVFLSFLKIPL